MRCFLFVLTFCLAVLPQIIHAQEGNQALPDPFTFNSGKKVKSVKDWERRRKEILETMTHEMYGVAPERPKNMRFEIFDLDKNALGGKATRKQVTVHMTEKGKEACEVVQKLYQRQLGSVETVGEVSEEDFRGLNKALVRLERFWSDQIRYRL